MVANNNMVLFRILVDADACPVKKEICAIAAEAELEVYFFASIAHHSNQPLEYDKLQYRYVDNFSQAVDMAIMNQLRPGDLVITQDIGLAALVLGGGGNAISPRGYIFRHDNITGLLETRHLDAKARQARVKTKGPKPFAREERQSFITSFREIVKKLLNLASEKENRQ